jgi:hypothetical protein
MTPHRKFLNPLNIGIGIQVEGELSGGALVWIVMAKPDVVKA